MNHSQWSGKATIYTTVLIKTLYRVTLNVIILKCFHRKMWSIKAIKANHQTDQGGRELTIDFPRQSSLKWHTGERIKIRLDYKKN